MAHLKKSILIHAPVEEVYALARDPNRGATWYVGLSEPEKLSGEGEVGTVIEQSFPAQIRCHCPPVNLA